MRYTAFLLLGLLLIVFQGESYHFLGPIAAKGFRPSLLIPLLVFLGVTETNLALGACVAFLLGYVLDVVGGAPIGLYTFSSVAVLALSRIAGVRIVTQTGIARALLAGAFDALSAVIVLVLLAIFGKSPWVPRSLARTILPHAIATIVFAPLVFRAATRVQMLLGGFLDPARTGEGKKLRTSSPALPNVAEGRRAP
ncbi:MAG: rod shape-determining protein MreD [Polyangiales bacterium]